jgi:formylglycine-generating enzyme required for sulfatase activity
MTGNAAEWVLDRKDEINDGHTCCAEGCTDPEPRDGAMPVIKGGGTMSSLPETRISSRVTLGFVTQSQEDRDTGVRCVLPADGRAERRWGTNDDR